MGQGVKLWILTPEYTEFLIEDIDYNSARLATTYQGVNDHIWHKATDFYAYTDIIFGE